MTDASDIHSLAAAPDAEEVGCTFIIFRGAFTGHVITCDACAWCKDPANAHRFRRLASEDR